MSSDLLRLPPKGNRGSRAKGTGRKGRAASIVSQEWPLSREQMSEQRRRHEEKAMQAEIRTICAHCGEHLEAPAAEGSAWYAKHLATVHPDIEIVHTPRKRQKGRMSKSGAKSDNAKSTPKAA